jgi:hypothetical protein
MATSSELLKQKRRDERWDEFMAKVRAAEAEKRAWPPFPNLDDPKPAEVEKKDRADG